MNIKVALVSTMHPPQIWKRQTCWSARWKKRDTLPLPQFLSIEPPHYETNHFQKVFFVEL